MGTPLSTRWLDVRSHLVRAARSSPVSARAVSELRLRTMRDNPKHTDLAECLRHVERGSTVVDVGASIGQYSLAFAHAAGPDGQVVALEPNPHDFAVLTRATWRMPVECLNVAASDAEGTASLHVPVDADGHELGPLGSLREGSNTGGHDVVVRCVTVDSVVPPEARVSLVKVDVEGFEVAVLQGARATIERHRPTVVCEIEHRHAPGNLERARDLMDDLGYDSYGITVTGRVPLADFDLERDQLAYVDDQGELTGAWETSYVNNFVFLPR